jgi:hypothetical protein
MDFKLRNARQPLTPTLPLKSNGDSARDPPGPEAERDC